MAQPGHSSLWMRRAWTTGSRSRVSEPNALGRLTQYATVLSSGAFHCRMVSIIRDSFMISYKWLNPLDVCNGLRWQRFGINCVDQLGHPALAALQGLAWMPVGAFNRDHRVWTHLTRPTRTPQMHRARASDCTFHSVQPVSGMPTVLGFLNPYRNDSQI